MATTREQDRFAAVKEKGISLRSRTTTAHPTSNTQGDKLPARLDTMSLSETASSPSVSMDDSLVAAPFSETVDCGSGSESELSSPPTLSDLSESDGEARPNKRIKINFTGHRAVVSKGVDDNNDDDDEVGPLAASSAQVSAPSQRQPKQPLKMVIMPKAEVDAIKDQNGILRSHNLSLARQRDTARKERDDAQALYEELKEAGSADHTDCVRMSDYKHVLDENDTLREETLKVRYEAQLMKECNMEFARRENVWELEKELMKQEVIGLMENVNEKQSQAQAMANELSQMQARVTAVERLAGQERERAHSLSHQLKHTYGQLLAYRQAQRPPHTQEEFQARFRAQAQQVQRQTQAQQQAEAEYQAQAQVQQQAEADFQGQAQQAQLEAQAYFEAQARAQAQAHAEEEAQAQTKTSTPYKSRYPAL